MNIGKGFLTGTGLVKRQLNQHSSHHHHWSLTQFTSLPPIINTIHITITDHQHNSHHHHWSSTQFTAASLIAYESWNPESHCMICRGLKWLETISWKQLNWSQISLKQLSCSLPLLGSYDRRSLFWAVTLLWDLSRQDG